MPILEPDPWRKQFFRSVVCPEETIIPTKDTDAYFLNPLHRWVYNKLAVIEIQSIPCGPHGTKVNIPYPIFSKPIYNLKGMGAGIEVITDEEHYRHSLKPGHMWSELFIGDHYSTDLAVVKGKVIWLCHTLGIPLKNGTFDYWVTTNNNALDNSLSYFVEKNLSNYNGMVNIETIGGKIIEIHLRFADQWTDLYGDLFPSSLVQLYHSQNFPVHTFKRPGYSVVLFLEPSFYKKPDKNFTDELLKIPGISSIQFPFYEDSNPNLHSMPPGGFRVAIINGFDLDSCKNVREQIRDKFNSS